MFSSINVTGRQSSRFGGKVPFSPENEQNENLATSRDLGTLSVLVERSLVLPPTSPAVFEEYAVSALHHRITHFVVDQSAYNGLNRPQDAYK